MADFEPAVAFVLPRVGGFVDHQSDPGGPTNFGISTRFLRSLGDLRDVRTLTREDATLLYRKHFWDRSRVGEIASQAVANKVLDLIVNMGERRGTFVVQRAVRACGHRTAEDGVIGNGTLAAVGMCSEEALIVALRCEAAAFYRLIGKDAFLKGWLARAYDEVA